MKKCQNCNLRYRVCEIVDGHQVIDDCHKHCKMYLDELAENERKKKIEKQEIENRSIRFISMKYYNEQYQRKKKNGGK